MNANGSSEQVRAALEAALAKAQELGYVTDEPKTKRPSDGQLARRWIAQNPGCRYGLGEMRRYRDGHWPAMGKETFRQSVLAMLQQAEAEGVRVTDRLLRSVIGLIETEVALPAERWDANYDIIVCANGTLDLRTYTLREHRPDDYATAALDYAYDPDARAPFFLAALLDAVPEAADFVQEFAGYCLVTDVSLETALWFYGPPGSGKSTIIEGICRMLGPRAGVLSLAEVEQSRFALSGIVGKTLLVSTEQPSLFMRSAYKLNALISGEPLSVERKYADPTVVRSTAKLLWAMNSLPRTDPGDGLFRRVLVVPFRQQIEDPDPELKARIANERAGILNWALEGLRRLRARGRFDPPAVVREATRQFQQTCDVPAQFLAECCELGGDYRVTGKALYDSYRAWCLDCGHQPMSITSAAEHWQRLGLVRYRSEGRTYYKGARLR